MKIPLLIMLHTNRKEHGLTMERLYEYCDISRQGFQKSKAKLIKESAMMLKIKALVNTYRFKKDRRAGSRSLYYNLNIKEHYKIGVTKFERLLSEYNLTLLTLNTRVITTKSCLQSWNYPNLCNGLTIRGINQLVVGDITYLSLGKNRYYFFCLTDVYSARIVGYHLSKRMRKQEAIKAFEMWLKLRNQKNLKDCIHHTDGGGQYFSKVYVKRMNDSKLQISVARDCLTNPYAEQKNCILKHHLIPTMQYANEEKLSKEIKRIIYGYNHNRKQENLGWKSPVEFEKNVKNLSLKLPMTLHNWDTNTPSKRIRF